MTLKRVNVVKHLRTDYELLESSSQENRRLLRQEELILNVTEALSEALLKEGITKTALAEKLGKSKGFVSQVLSGGRNLTLRTVADVADALDCRINVQVVSWPVTTQTFVGCVRDSSPWQFEERPQVQPAAVTLRFAKRPFDVYLEGAA
jgi:transcriptional regulator with XRE-family HTH domain